MEQSNLFISDKKAELEEYFNSLPIYVQESIKQTGVCFSSKEELQNCAQGMMERSDNA